MAAPLLYSDYDGIRCFDGLRRETQGIAQNLGGDYATSYRERGIERIRRRIGVLTSDTRDAPDQNDRSTMILANGDPSTPILVRGHVIAAEVDARRSYRVDLPE